MRFIPFYICLGYGLSTSIKDFNNNNNNNNNSNLCLYNVYICLYMFMKSREYSDHPRLCVILYARARVCVCVCVCVFRIKIAETKFRQTWHRDSPSRYFSHQLILGHKVKGQGDRVTKCKKVIEWPA